MKSLILTGPESTGKSNIAQYLADELNIALIPEYSRSFLNERNGVYGYEDLCLMAQNAQSLINNRQESKRILDTDILTYKIWSEIKFQRTDPWIDRNMPSNNDNLYLLCYPDIDWTPDPLRESPNDRLKLFSSYEALLQALSLQYYIICGKNSRLSSSLEIATDYFNF